MRTFKIRIVGLHLMPVYLLLKYCIESLSAENFTDKWILCWKSDWLLFKTAWIQIGINTVQAMGSKIYQEHIIALLNNKAKKKIDNNITTQLTWMHVTIYLGPNFCERGPRFVSLISHQNGE